jgi:hypothetical protein
MTPERLREIQDLFHSVRECEAEERVRLLAQADRSLLTEVESLLAQETASLPDLDLEVQRIETGTQIGSYRIEAVIGEGGMGTVYRALDPKFSRPVAIKLLHEGVADAAVRRRFQREAQMASSLNHPHIVTVFDAGEFEARHFLVTEFVDGGTLKEWARSKKRTWQEIDLNRQTKFCSMLPMFETLGGRQTRSDIFFSFEFVLPESPSHPNPDGGPKLAAGRNEKSLAAAAVIVQNDRAVLAW